MDPATVAPPPGFELDAPQDSGPPPPPEGFQLDQAQPQPPEGFTLDEPQSSAVGAGARSFARTVIPNTVGALAGLATAAGFAPEVSPFVSIPAGFAVAGATTYAAQKVQDELTDKLGITSEEQRTADETQHPIASTVGELATALPTFGFGLESALAKRALSGAIVGGGNIVQQGITKGPGNIDPTEALTAAGVGAALPNVRPWAGRASGALTEAVQGALGRGGGNGNPPGGAATTEAAKAQAQTPDALTQAQAVDRANDLTKVSQGTAEQNIPAPGAQRPGGGAVTRADNETPLEGNVGVQSVGSERNYGVGQAAEGEGVQGAPSTPIDMLDPAQAGMPAGMADAIRGQQGEEPNAQIEKAPPPPAQPPPQAPEQGAPQAQRAPQAPGPGPAPAGGPGQRQPAPVENLNPNEGIQQQAQQRQPSQQRPGESDEAFNARVMQAQAAQNASGGRYPGAPYDLAAADKIRQQATKAVEQANGDTIKEKPPAAQTAIDAADEAKGRVPLRTRNAVEKWLNNTFLGKTFAPEGIDQSGAEAKAAMRSNLGEIQDRYDRFNAAFNQPLRDIFNNLTPEQGHEIQRALQDPNPMERLAKWPELEPAVRELRNQIKADADFKVKKGSLDAEQLERDHFPQLWKNPEKDSQEFLDNWYARQGSKAGFKQKLHPTIADGEAAGLQLKYTNPLDPIAARMKSDYRYQMLNSVLQDAMGHNVFTEDAPGRIPLNAKINGMGGRQLYANEGWGTVFNNHYSPGWRDTPAGKQFMDVAQPATAWGRSLLLGLSPFHAITMANEAMISQLKLGMQTMQRDPVEGAKIISKSPFGAGTLYSAGKKVQKAAVATQIEPDSPFVRTVPALKKANARFFGGQGSTLDFNPGEGVRPLAPAPAETILQSLTNGLKEAKSDISAQFKDAQGKPVALGKATLKSIGTAVQAFSHPLFNEIIPAMKAGAAHMELGEYLRQHPEVQPGSPEEHDIAMRIWDDVENRFGLMTHDNLWWHNKFKEGAQIGMTSPTWTTGFIKNFAGGIGRGVMHPSRALMGSKDYDPNISSAISLGIAVAITSGVYQYLKTGKPPGSIYDLMAPQTGGKTKQGQPERAILPGFQKDVYGYFHDPLNEAFNKIGPVPKTLIETATNKGWTQTPKGPRYGLISNPNDPFWKQAADRAGHIVNNLTPISVQQLRKSTAPGTNISTPERASAIREAPKWINPGGNPAERAAIQREYKQTHP